MQLVMQTLTADEFWTRAEHKPLEGASHIPTSDISELSETLADVATVRDIVTVLNPNSRAQLSKREIKMLLSGSLCFPYSSH